MRRRRFLSMVLVVALLAACGSNAEQTAQTARYTVALRLDGSGTNEQVAVITVTDGNGQPAAVDEVVLAPVMRDMGMASPEVVATPDGAGRYLARGTFFSMTGAWELDVRLVAAGVEERVSFAVPVQ